MKPLKTFSSRLYCIHISFLFVIGGGMGWIDDSYGAWEAAGGDERDCEQCRTVKTAFFSNYFSLPPPALIASDVIPTAPSYPFAYWYLPILYIQSLSNKGGRGMKNEIIDYRLGAEVIVIGVSLKELLWLRGGE